MCHLTRRAFGRCALGLAALVLAGLPSMAQPRAGENAPALTHEFRLPMREDMAHAHRFDVFSGRELKFKKEPDEAGEHLCRGAITIGPEKSDYIGFLFDPGAQRLYLDVNRNLDLTDDLGGVYESTREDRGGGVFEGISIELPFGEGTAPYLLALHCAGQDQQGFYFSHISSGWEGVIELGGKKRRMIFAENMDGVANDKDLWVLGPDAAELRGYTAFRALYTGGLFLDGQGYEVGLAAEGQELVVTFTEIETPMGEIVLLGESIERFAVADLGLGDEQRPMTVVLDTPGQAEVIPAGTYTWRRALLRSETPEVLFYMSARKGLSVAKGGSRQVKAGGPLTNRVEAWKTLLGFNLSYDLVGVDGLPYNRIGRDRENPPRFEVRKHGHVVGAGQFEYG